MPRVSERVSFYLRNVIKDYKLRASNHKPIKSHKIKKLLLFMCCLFGLAAFSNAATTTKTTKVGKKTTINNKVPVDKSKSDKKLVAQIFILTFSEDCGDGTTYDEVCVTILVDQGTIISQCTDLSSPCPILPPTP